MNEPSTTQAVIEWHDTWRPTLAESGVQIALIRPVGVAHTVLLSLRLEDRVVRLLVRNGDRVETSYQGGFIPQVPAVFENDEQVICHIGELAAWVLAAKDQKSTEIE